MPKITKPRTRRAIIKFLSGHMRYHTMNSWNAATSYANCIKAHRLDLTSDEASACLAMLDVGGAHEISGFNDMLRQFDQKHDYTWQIGVNGRSGGYLVLYQGGRKPSGYPSYCTACGQRNYQAVQASSGGNICGRCGRPDLVNYAALPMETFTWPGKGLDMGEDFGQWSLGDISARLRLVWDFDETCRLACREFIDFAMRHRVEDREILVPRKVRVAVPLEPEAA